jgi:outer membrane protein assembly factor BamD (BamD/ComL family)
MNRTYDIVVGVMGLVVILVLTGWVFFRALKRSDDPAKLALKWLFTVPFVIFCFVFAVGLGPFGPFVIVLLGVGISIMWAPHISEWLFKPLTNLIDGGDEEPVPKPLYSTAQTRRKQGKFLEAAVEVRKQLDRFPNDFEGVMLLAGVQAKDMKDLASAEITLNHFCSRPDAPPTQIAAAFNHLADWHLKLAQDTDSARAALENIVARFPDTKLSLQAAQRIAHLGGTGKILLAAHDRQPVAMPEGVKNVGLLASSEFLRPEEIEPGRLASVYVKHLEQHPLDAEIREKLAIIYADHFQRLDLATGELEQLIDQPNQPARQVAHWLNLLADLQTRHGTDYEAVRRTLGKIVERFPDSAVAEVAQRRLARLKLEMKGQKETPGVKLGVYEQNIGLKYGPPRQ